MDWWNQLQNEWNNFWNFTHGGQPWSAPTPPPVQNQPPPSSYSPPSGWDNFTGTVGQDFSNLGSAIHGFGQDLFGHPAASRPQPMPPAHLAGAVLPQPPTSTPPPFIHTEHGPYYHPAFHPATGQNPHPAPAAYQNANANAAFQRGPAQTQALNAPAPPPVGAAHGVQIG